MYPFFEIFNWFYIYTFWLTLTFCFFLFLWMLKRLCQRFGINDTFFFNRIFKYFLSVFVFSRLFYVIANWDEMKFIKSPLEFFLMSDYNFSLVGALFWYLLVLFISIVLHGLRSGKYMDVSVLSFLFVSVLWYIGAFLWWQVYGKETNLGIEILYKSIISPVPYEVPIFPLALVYAFVSFLLFCGLYMVAMFVKVRGIIGYTGVILFSIFLLILEIFNGKSDYFEKLGIWLNFTQICAIVLIWFWLSGLYRIYKTPTIHEII